MERQIIDSERGCCVRFAETAEIGHAAEETSKDAKDLEKADNLSTASVSYIKNKSRSKPKNKKSVSVPVACFVENLTSEDSVKLGARLANVDVQIIFVKYESPSLWKSLKLKTNLKKDTMW